MHLSACLHVKGMSMTPSCQCLCELPSTCSQHGTSCPRTACQALPAGSLKLLMPDGAQTEVRIERAHMEEDAGKSSHAGGGASTVDYNRAGVSFSRAPALHLTLESLGITGPRNDGLWPSSAAGSISQGFRATCCVVSRFSHMPGVDCPARPVELTCHYPAGMRSCIGGALSTWALRSKASTHVPPLGTADTAPGRCVRLSHWVRGWSWGSTCRRTVAGGGDGAGPALRQGGCSLCRRAEAHHGPPGHPGHRHAGQGPAGQAGAPPLLWSGLTGRQ